MRHTRVPQPFTSVISVQFTLLLPPRGRHCLPSAITYGVGNTFWLLLLFRLNKSNALSLLVAFHFARSIKCSVGPSRRKQTSRKKTKPAKDTRRKRVFISMQSLAEACGIGNKQACPFYFSSISFFIHPRFAVASQQKEKKSSERPNQEKRRSRGYTFRDEKNAYAYRFFWDTVRQASAHAHPLSVTECVHVCVFCRILAPFAALEGTRR